jgi:hypothetical protein
MKVPLHASCPKWYGRNLVPRNSYPLPSHYELMTDNHPLLKGSSKMSPLNLGARLFSLISKLSMLRLDYNILFGRSYMYAMKAVASSVFRTMMFPHNGNIVTIDQVSHYEPNPYANLDNILPLIHTNQDIYPLIEMGLGIFKDPSLLGTYHGAPPLLHPANQVCVISSNGTHMEDALHPQEASVIPDVSIVAEPLPIGASCALVDLNSPRIHIPSRE